MSSSSSSSSSSVDIVLKRPNRIYHENETIYGSIVLNSKSESSHQGITLHVEGTVNMQLSSKNVGIIEAFYNSIRPLTLISYTVEVSKSGKIPQGKISVPFELPLKSKGNKPLMETYHGVYIAIQYTIRVEVRKSLLNKDLMKCLEFMIECPNTQTMAIKKPLSFEMTPDSIVSKTNMKIPSFQVTGHLDSSVCTMSEMLTGEITVSNFDAVIESIECQLIRVETCGCDEGYAKESTEVQNIQVATNDVVRGLPIPLCMVFPRLFSCPTLATTNFKIQFEVNIIIIFDQNNLISRSFPIKLVRN